MNPYARLSKWGATMSRNIAVQGRCYQLMEHLQPRLACFFDLRSDIALACGQLALLVRGAVGKYCRFLLLIPYACSLFHKGLFARWLSTCTLWALAEGMKSRREGQIDNLRT